MSKRITQTKDIQTGDNSGVVFSGNEKASYLNEYPLDSFMPKDLMTRKAVEDLIGADVPVSSSIIPWNPLNPTDEDNYVTYPIDGIEYLFRSKVDGNISEPTLGSESSGAWIQTDFFGFISSWTSFVSYSIGNLVTGDANSNIYRSKVNGNEGISPNGGANPDEWELVGAYIGFYFEGVFNLGDVVIVSDEGNRIYISNIADNDKPLTDIVGDSQWQLVGIPILDYKIASDSTWSSQKISDAIAGGSSLSLTFDQSDLVEVYEGNYSLSFDLPDRKSIASIDIAQGTVIRRLSPTQAVTDTANSPNTIIEGFDNNSTQEITIKLI